jgi:hypothetical protein
MFVVVYWIDYLDFVFLLLKSGLVIGVNASDKKAIIIFSIRIRLIIFVDIINMVVTSFRGGVIRLIRMRMVVRLEKWEVINVHLEVRLGGVIIHIIKL